MRTRPHGSLAGLAGLLTGLLAACSSSPVGAAVAAGPSPAAAAPTTSAAAPVPSPDAAELDAYRPADDAFWDGLRLEGAVVVRPPDLPDLAAGSTVAVLARVVDVRPSRVVHGTRVLAVVLEPRRVLGGRLRAAGPVRVETPSLGPTPAAGHAAQLRAALPAGLSVWYLRWQGTPPATTKPGAPAVVLPTDPDLYALTHPFGVFVQGRRTVVAPLSEAGVPQVGFLRDIRAYHTMSGLLRNFS